MVAPKILTPLSGLELFAGGAPAGVVELRENVGFGGVAWVVAVAVEFVAPNKEPPVGPLPPPNSPPGLLAAVP